MELAKKTRTYPQEYVSNQQMEIYLLARIVLQLEEMNEQFQHTRDMIAELSETGRY